VSDDWYRSSAWGSADQALFEEKLRRARPWSRAQYLRLKGAALAASSRRREREAAPGLLSRVIREYAEDELQVAMTWSDLGRYYSEERDWESAAGAFRSCLDAEAAYSGSLETGSELALAEVIVAAEWADRYGEALVLLDAADRAVLTFKVERWRWLIARARIAARMGHDDEAASSATRALALLDDPQPDFPRHPDVGLISPDRSVVRELKQLAAP
jgi:tetratricopeptide (TPR) repeat protein